MDPETPTARAVLSVLLLIAGLFVWRVRAGARSAPAASPHPPASRVCWGAAGASARPGIRCDDGPSAPGDFDPLPPCDDPEVRGRIAERLRACPPHGRILWLGPERPGGGCRPRWVPMSAAVRIALGIPLEFADASVDDLAAIPGVGRRTAERLVERRARNPGGTDPLRVPGIGPRTGDRLRAALRFGPVSPPDCR